MDLTQEQSMTMDQLGAQSSLITKEGNSDKWKNNIRDNRQYFCKGNPDLKGLTAYVVCAGPSLDKNVEDLKLMSERGIIICLDAALRFVVSRGIVPEYCIMIDGSDKMLKMTEGIDTSNTTLICTPSASPKVVSSWKGPLFFITTPYLNSDKIYNHHHLTRIVKAEHDIKKGDELVLGDDYNVEFQGITGVIICGGNVSTAAHHFALVHLKAQQVVFTGLDLSWKYESHHYAGHEHQDNVYDRTKTGAASVKDMHGETISTNLQLMSFKRWHEQFSDQFPGTVINATEGGILGVEQDGSTSKNIKLMTLKEAIEEYTPLPKADK